MKKLLLLLIPLFIYAEFGASGGAGGGSVTGLTTALGDGRYLKKADAPDTSSFALKTSLSNYLPIMGTSADSAKLGGKLPADYALKTDAVDDTQLNLKVDKEAGKSLSTNDYTDADKAKLVHTNRTALDKISSSGDLTQSGLKLTFTKTDGTTKEVTLKEEKFSFANNELNITKIDGSKLVVTTGTSATVLSTTTPPAYDAATKKIKFTWTDNTSSDIDVSSLFDDKYLVKLEKEDDNKSFKYTLKDGTEKKLDISSWFVGSAPKYFDSFAEANGQEIKPNQIFIVGSQMDVNFGGAFINKGTVKIPFATNAVGINQFMLGSEYKGFIVADKIITAPFPSGEEEGTTGLASTLDGYYTSMNGTYGTYPNSMRFDDGMILYLKSTGDFYKYDKPMGKFSLLPKSGLRGAIVADKAELTALKATPYEQRLIRGGNEYVFYLTDDLKAEEKADVRNLEDDLKTGRWVMQGLETELFREFKYSIYGNLSANKVSNANESIFLTALKTTYNPFGYTDAQLSKSLSGGRLGIVTPKKGTIDLNFKVWFTVNSPRRCTTYVVQYDKNNVEKKVYSGLTGGQKVDESQALGHISRLKVAAGDYFVLKSKQDSTAHWSGENLTEMEVAYVPTVKQLVDPKLVEVEDVHADEIFKTNITKAGGVQTITFAKMPNDIIIYGKGQGLNTKAEVISFEDLKQNSPLQKSISVHGNRSETLTDSSEIVHIDFDVTYIDDTHISIAVVKSGYTEQSNNFQDRQYYAISKVVARYKSNKSISRSVPSGYGVLLFEGTTNSNTYEDIDLTTQLPSNKRVIGITSVLTEFNTGYLTADKVNSIDLVVQMTNKTTIRLQGKNKPLL